MSIKKNKKCMKIKKCKKILGRADKDIDARNR